MKTRSFTTRVAGTVFAAMATVGGLAAPASADEVEIGNCRDADYKVVVSAGGAGVKVCADSPLPDATGDGE